MDHPHLPCRLRHILNQQRVALYGVANYYQISPCLAIFVYFLRGEDAAAYKQRYIYVAAYFVYHLGAYGPAGAAAGIHVYYVLALQLTCPCGAEGYLGLVVRYGLGIAHIRYGRLHAAIYDHVAGGDYFQSAGLYLWRRYYMLAYKQVCIAARYKGEVQQRIGIRRNLCRAPREEDDRYIALTFEALNAQFHLVGHEQAATHKQVIYFGIITQPGKVLHISGGHLVGVCQYCKAAFAKSFKRL